MNETSHGAAAAPKKKHLLENAVVKFVFALMGYAAPAPMLLSLIELWLRYFAAPAQQSDALTVFRQLFSGGGTPPYFLLPLALVPSLLLFSLLFRGERPRIIALALLPVVALAEAIAVMQFLLT